MKIVCIFEQYLYSVKYDLDEFDKYNDLFEKWTDLLWVKQFIDDNVQYLDCDLFNIKSKQEAYNRIVEEAYDLEDYYYKLLDNAKKGESPNFISHFQPLDGQYRYIYEYIPMKSYGTKRPSFLRMYALKIDDCFLIVDGGIKLAMKMQDAPDIKEHVFNNINNVRLFLRQNGITDVYDVEQFIQNDDED